MANSNFSLTPMCSMVVLKYSMMRLVERKPFEPGERMGAWRNMEKKLKGYKQLREELVLLRKLIELQKRTRHDVKKPVKTKYYQSPLRTR